MRFAGIFAIVCALVPDALAQPSAGMVPDAGLVPNSDAGADTRDAGISDAAPPDAAPPDAAPPDAAPSAEELAQVEERERLARQAEEAARAEAVILSMIQGESERLDEIERGQAAFRRDRLVCQGAGGTPLDRLSAELEPMDADARYERVLLELDHVQTPAIRAARALWGGLQRVPDPGQQLPRAITTLPPGFAVQVAGLDDRRRVLRGAARALDNEFARHLDGCAQLLYERESELAAMRVALYRELSDERRADILDYRGQTRAALAREAGHLAIEILHWLRGRYRDAGRAGRLFTDFALMWRVAIWLLQIGLVLAIASFALRRWDDWMVVVAELIGSNLHLGGWILFGVRLVEFARGFGPALLVLGSAAFLYRHLGAGAAPIEVRVLYVVVFWLALLRAQLRLVERAARQLAVHLAERAARAEYEAESDTDASAAEASTGAPGATAEPAPATAGNAAGGLAGGPAGGPRAPPRGCSWRAFTRYAAVAMISSGLVRLAAGPAVSHHLVRLALRWGLMPLGVYCLWVWRPWIVLEYVKRSRADSWLTAFTQKHGERFYGVLVLVVALIVVLVRQIGRFIKRNLSDLDATKRLLALLFRRRVEKRAQQRGVVVTKLQDLPAEILAEFPSGPMDPEDRPVKPPFLDEIKQIFTVWQEDKVEGSVVIVGAAGMGKSTALRLLEGTLGEPVSVYKVSDKYTSPESLVSGLSKLIDLPRVPTDESTFITELERSLEEQGRRVIALDNCHHFFLRKVGGFAAWEAFTRIVNQTSHRIFWVVSCNAASWDYLHNIAGGISYFRRVIEMPPWTDEELRRLILTRMRRAKYRINFTDLLVTRLQGVKTSTQIIRTSQGYFRLLWDFTDGNPRAACHFWLRSLMPDVDRRRVRVHLFSAPRIEELELLPDDIAFVLAALVEHEALTAEELATVSNLSLEFARFALQYCREHGYMWQSERTARTKLSTHWHQPIVRYLQRRHLLYS